MKILILYSFTILLSVTFYSCSEDTVSNNGINENGNFTYPFELNTSWYYGTRNFAFNFRPDSIKNIFGSDTLSGFGEARFLRDTVIGNDTFRVLRNSHSDAGHSHATFELYKQSDSLLIRYYYASSGSNFGPYRHGNRNYFTFKGKNYNSVAQIFSTYGNEPAISIDKHNGDTNLFIDFPPKRILRYPIAPGYEWVVYYGDTGDKVAKKYLNYENISLLGKDYYCIKIQKLWYSNIFGSPDSHLILYDYFSKEGMVKRDFTIKDIAVSNKFGQIIGYFDSREESFLNIYFQP